MADKKISQLSNNASIDGTEIVPVAKSGSTLSNTLTAIKTWILSAISGFVKTDGTTTGATSQAQEFTEGVTVTNVNGTVTITERMAKAQDISITRNDSDDSSSITAALLNNGTVVSSNNSTGSFSRLKPNGTIEGLNVAHPSALATPADAVTINGVKVYRALLTQNSTNPPTIVLLENTLGEVPASVYDATGSYKLETSGDVFATGKTLVTITHFVNGDITKTVSFLKETPTRLRIYSFSSGSPADDVLSSTEIKIEVYP